MAAWSAVCVCVCAAPEGCASKYSDDLDAFIIGLSHDEKGSADLDSRVGRVASKAMQNEENWEDLVETLRESELVRPSSEFDFFRFAGPLCSYSAASVDEARMLRPVVSISPRLARNAAVNAEIQSDLVHPTDIRMCLPWLGASSTIWVDIVVVAQISTHK